MHKGIPFPSWYRLGQFALDGFVAWIAASLAFWIRFEGNIPSQIESLFWLLPLFAIPGRLIIQTTFGIYKQVWRLFGFQDATALGQAISFYSLLILVINRLAAPHLPLIPESLTISMPLGVAVIDWCFCLMGMMILRYARRRLCRLSQGVKNLSRQEKQRVVLVGAGRSGSQIVQEVRHNCELNWEIAGFADDDTTKIGRKVEGISVLGNTAQLVAIANKVRAKEIIISMPSAKAEKIRQILSLVRGSNLNLKVLPGPAELISDHNLTPQAREIQIQDILGRPEIHLDFSEDFDCQFSSAREQVYQRTVLVTGAGGTIGAEICRQLARLRPKTLLLLGRGENSIFNIEQELLRNYPYLSTISLIADIRHQGRIEKILKIWQPQIIFHAAAHKHVPLMEHNPTEAIENNTLASANLAQLANQQGVETFVLISTDKAVDPANFMGLSKRLAELMVKATAHRSNTRFLAVRFGNVLGSRGSVVPIFKKQIARGGPVTVTDCSMTRYFMTTPEASQLVIQSLAVGKSGQTLILDMGKPVKIYDLAEQMIYLAGFTPEIDIPIQVTGLRPGEKLHESLIGSGERVISTKHPKIMAVSGCSPSSEALSGVIASLTEATFCNLPPKQLWQISQQCSQKLESSLVVKV